MVQSRQSLSGMSQRLLLPAPTPRGDDAAPRTDVVSLAFGSDVQTALPSGWSSAVARQVREREPASLLQEQRDGLARVREKLLATIRELEDENTSLRNTLGRYDNYPSLEQQTQENALAEQLRAERGITFHEMPNTVYPGRPYVTQQDLVRQGITHYTRQNISRLSRSVGALVAMVIGDRVLLPPEAVEALIKREAAASRDPSPRRRPGRKSRRS